jgi:hypothetical protein
MKGTYNPCDAGKGMSNLLIQHAYGPKSNKVVTPEAELKEAKEAAAKESKATSTMVTSAFTLCSEAQEEADRCNVAAQAVIGAKEGVVKALTALVGTNITNSMLHTSDGNFKSVDMYTVHKVMQAANENADRPPMTDLLEQLIKVLHYTFDFCKKISANMELVQNLANRMSPYGIEVGTPLIVLMLLANIKIATKHEYGWEFQSAMQSIRTKYAYNYKYDKASLKVILMTGLAKADSVRTLKDAPAPGTATAHSVADTIKQLKTMTGNILCDCYDKYNKDNTVSDYDTAYGATTDDSSTDTKSHKTQRSHKGCKAKEADDLTETKEKKKKKNNCPHCKKFNQRCPYPNILKDKCFWNKKYKGWCPRTVCNELEVEFKPRSKFTAKLGGYPEDDSK